MGKLRLIPHNANSTPCAKCGWPITSGKLKKETLYRAFNTRSNGWYDCLELDIWLPVCRKCIRKNRIHGIIYGLYYCLIALYVFSLKFCIYWIFNGEATNLIKILTIIEIFIFPPIFIICHEIMDEKFGKYMIIERDHNQNIKSILKDFVEDGWVSNIYTTDVKPYDVTQFQAFINKIQKKYNYTIQNSDGYIYDINDNPDLIFKAFQTYVE